MILAIGQNWNLNYEYCGINCRTQSKKIEIQSLTLPWVHASLKVENPRRRIRVRVRGGRVQIETQQLGRRGENQARNLEIWPPPPHSHTRSFRSISGLFEFRSCKTPKTTSHDRVLQRERVAPKAGNSGENGRLKSETDTLTSVEQTRGKILTVRALKTDIETRKVFSLSLTREMKHICGSQGLNFQFSSRRQRREKRK